VAPRKCWVSYLRNPPVCLAGKFLVPLDGAAVPPVAVARLLVVQQSRRVFRTRRALEPQSLMELQMAADAVVAVVVVEEPVALSQIPRLLPLWIPRTPHIALR
jgi:hypothetical protein